MNKGRSKAGAKVTRAAKAATIKNSVQKLDKPQIDAIKKAIAVELEEIGAPSAGKSVREIVWIVTQSILLAAAFGVPLWLVVSKWQSTHYGADFFIYVFGFIAAGCALLSVPLKQLKLTADAGKLLLNVATITGLVVTATVAFYDFPDFTSGEQPRKYFVCEETELEAYPTVCQELEETAYQCALTENSPNARLEDCVGR